MLAADTTDTTKVHERVTKFPHDPSRIYNRQQQLDELLDELQRDDDHPTTNQHNTTNRLIWVSLAIIAALFIPVFTSALLTDGESQLQLYSVSLLLALIMYTLILIPFGQYLHHERTT